MKLNTKASALFVLIILLQSVQCTLQVRGRYLSVAAHDVLQQSIMDKHILLLHVHG